MNQNYTFNLKQFLDILEEKKVKIRCPMCAHHPHAAVPNIDEGVYLTVPAGTGSYPKTQVGYYYAIGLVCKNCGHISQFSGNWVQDYLDGNLDKNN